MHSRIADSRQVASSSFDSSDDSLGTAAVGADCPTSSMLICAPTLAARR